MDHPDEQRLDFEGKEQDTVSFTDWVNEPELSDLKQDYEDAKSAHDVHVDKIDIWLDNLNVRNKAKHVKVEGRSEIVPKLIRKQAEWRYASLSEPFLSTEDIFNTAPVTHEDKEAAVQNGLVLNSQFNTKIQKVKFIDEYIRTAVDEGTVIVRIGWTFEEEEIEVPNMVPTPIPDLAAAQAIAQGVQALQQDPNVVAQLPPEMLEDIQLSMEVGYPAELAPDPDEPTTTIMETTKNEPNLEVCNYQNLMVDPSCQGDLSKANFIIYSFDTSRAELEKTGLYKNLDQIMVEDNSILGAPDHDGGESETTSFNFTDKPRKKFVAYEYWGFWDTDNTGMVRPIVSTWVGATMIRLGRNPFPDKELPFISAQYLPVRKSIYGEPDGELLEDNQKVIGAVTRGMIDIMARSANGQQGTRKDALDITNQRKFNRGEDYEFNPQVSPEQAFHMSVYPEIPQSAAIMLQMQNAEAESISGVKAFSGTGITGNALGDSVGGQKNAMDAVSKRELGILRRMAEGVKQIGRKITSMNTEFLDEEEVVRITNDEFVTVQRDNLSGDIDISLTISTAEADNDKASELAFMLQTLGPNAEGGMVRLIQGEIATLRKMPHLAKKLEDYQEPGPTPLEQEKMQLEIELLKAQVYNETAKGHENNANANLDNAKARTEGSNADKTDLDFVEQESGVTQERDLQKGQAQAVGNIALEREKQKAPKPAKTN